MTDNRFFVCDGCSQPASTRHIANRLQRLEWTTRYRPVHIGTLLLGAVAPVSDAEFLYADPAQFKGEAKHVLAAAGVSPTGKAGEVTLSEFQRAGFLLTHVLECPLDGGMTDPAVTKALLSGRLAVLVARIRRSLRPKRLVPISAALAPLVASLQATDLACPIVLDNGKAFALDDDEVPDRTIERLRKALAGNGAAGKGLSSGA
jgi:hypothetical protein